AEGAPGELGAGASRYRVAWRDEHGELEERQTDDPTALLHQLTSAALARGEPLRDLSVTRPSLEDGYLELTAQETADGCRRNPRLAPVPLRTPDVLAQSDGGVLQLLPAAAVPRAVRGDLQRQPEEPERDRARHRRHERHGDHVQRARDERHVPARAGRAQAH